VQEDPLGSVHRLYEWFGEPVTPEFEAGMQQWWQAEAATRAANTHPDAATFGLTTAKLRPVFANYINRAREWTAASAAKSPI